MSLLRLAISTYPTLRISNSQHLPNLVVLFCQEIRRDRLLRQYVLGELCTCWTRTHASSDVARMITCWHVRIDTHNVTSINGQHIWQENFLSLGHDMGMNSFLVPKFEVFYNYSYLEQEPPSTSRSFYPHNATPLLCTITPNLTQKAWV